MCVMHEWKSHAFEHTKRHTLKGNYREYQVGEWKNKVRNDM